jgi:hypothetical protein
MATSAQDEETLNANASQIAAIIRYAAESGGQVDKSLHDRFWALIPDEVKKDPSEFFQRFVFVGAINFQKQLWESIRLSARAKSVVKTADYESAKEHAFANNPKGQEMSARADRMLAAAATGEPYQGQSGDTKLTEEYASRILDSVNASYAQLQLLLNPVWEGP